MIELLWNSPTSEASMAQHLEVLDLQASSTALDIGCGCGEFSIRLVERFGVRCRTGQQSVFTTTDFNGHHVPKITQ